MNLFRFAHNKIRCKQLFIHTIQIVQRTPEIKHGCVTKNCRFDTSLQFHGAKRDENGRIIPRNLPSVSIEVNKFERTHVGEEIR